MPVPHPDEPYQKPEIDPLQKTYGTNNKKT
jgi:hypothetical protein